MLRYLVRARDIDGFELEILAVRGGVMLLMLGSIPNSADPMVVWLFLHSLWLDKVGSCGNCLW